MKTGTKLEQVVQSPIGKERLDRNGPAVGVSRMDPDKAYGTIPLLLQQYINSGSEKAWQEICQRIDNIYITLSSALEALDAAESFSPDIQKQLGFGKKLFFKPNLVSLPSLDFETHGPVLTGTCLPWEFLAAVMRWFHDKRGIYYHQMALGEAGTTTHSAAFLASGICGRPVCAQALMEGKFGNNYGGWGFYFTRQYLAGCHDSTHTDDPMLGYEESLAGVCIPPGKSPDKLLIYDLNKIAADFSNGRDVPVSDGINFKTITLHKAIVGGEPDNPEDLRNWPGCVLVNVTKLKVHLQELFTGAVKNLGIGLYPMEVNQSREPGKFVWKYAMPDLQIPAAKMKLPHNRWTVKYDEDTGIPIRDKDGNYVFIKTGGMESTVADVIQAVKGQGIKMLHIIDAIETTNINHCAPGCTPVPEGLVFTSNDIVAADACASRYLFNMVPMAEINRIRKKYNLTSEIIQEVPLPEIEGSNIINGKGYDSPFSRYNLLEYCEKRGLGQQKFQVVGNDLWKGGNLASLKQHLGQVEDGVYTELLTSTLYYTPPKLLWDLQATSLAYLECNDRLTASDYKRQILQYFDENQDGIIDYMETKRRDFPFLLAYGAPWIIQDIDPLESLKFRFLLEITQLKLSKKEWNSNGHDIGEQSIVAKALVKAFDMANSEQEMPDPYFPTMTWGRGKWPSLKYAMHQHILTMMYGMTFPEQFDLLSPYGYALCYADSRWNGAKYSSSQAKNRDIIGTYHQDVARGADLLPFIVYLPREIGNAGSERVPNIEETDDPKLIFTASFNDKEVWRDFRLSDFRLK